MQLLSDRLKIIKEEQSIRSNADLARMVGVSPQAVGQWLNGTTQTMDAKVAFKLQKLWGYSAEWLYDGSGQVRLKDAIADQRAQYQSVKHQLDLRLLSPAMAEVIKSAYNTALRVDGAGL
jgi:transcriptional regulator with XRE-family HTH domain